MNVLYSTDNNYAKICYASLNSFLESNKDNNIINIYIIDNKIDKSMKNKIINLVKDYKKNVVFISCKKICKNLIKNNDFPISAYARLFVQDEILDDKVIYIDCDTLVRNDLSELWNMDLDDNLIGGVIDPLPDYLKKSIGMKNDDQYINSGVLLINLKKWREVDFRGKSIEFIEKYNYNVVHHDQGILNGICCGKILYIHPKFNLIPDFICMTSKQICKLYKLNSFYSQEELDVANNNPYIVHFLSKFYNRPWYKECTSPYKDEFVYYYSRVCDTLSSHSLNFGVRFRRFIFYKFPFSFYVLLERVLDFKRSRNIRK